MSDDGGGAERAPRVRLRLAGAPAADAAPIAEESARIALPDPSIAVVATVRERDAEAMAAALVTAAREAGLAAVQWRARLRSASDAGVDVERSEEDGALVIRAPAGAIGAAIAELARAAGASGTLHVVVGAPFVAIARPTLAIAVGAAGAVVRWDPAVRALRDRLDLIVDEPRPGLAPWLVARLRARR